MAKYKARINGHFDSVVEHIKREIMQSSLSSSLEEQETIYKGNVKICILAFERYSYSGGNRLSLNVIIVGENDNIDIVGTTTGGSNATFFKFNTIGEDAFLEKLIQAINKL